MSLLIVLSGVMAKYLAFIWFLLYTADTHNFRAYLISGICNLSLTNSIPHTVYRHVRNLHTCQIPYS